MARDLVRAVQQARRDAGLDVSDRIALVIGGRLRRSLRAARTHAELIARETLATSYRVEAPREGTARDRRSRRSIDARAQARPEGRAGWMGRMDLDLTADVVTLTEQLVDIESVSRNEQAIADAVEAALAPLPHLT